MPRRSHAHKIIQLCLFIALFAYGQEKNPIPGLQGNLADQNVYTNPALGMTIGLPGTWTLTEITRQTARDPACTGPLCGTPEIKIELETKSESSLRYKIYLAAYKLWGEYLNRNRYSLKWFAEIMMEGSLGGSNLVPIGERSAIQFGGRPAYRLLAARPGNTTPRSLGYVSESNGYVFLLVGAAPTRPQLLQSAIETMKLR
jgi:hypothetical protein